jgi:hypothetical protein
MFRQSGLLVEIIPELGGGGERGRVTEIRMGQGRGGLPPPAAAPLPCIRSGLPPRRSTASPRTSTRRVRLLLSAHAVAMEKPKSEPGASAATKDDHASPDRLPTDSGSLDGAPSSRATAPQQPSDQHAASAAAAAYDARATPPDPDAVWSIVLAKFGRGRRGGVDLAAHTFLDPASGVAWSPPSASRHHAQAQWRSRRASLATPPRLLLATLPRLPLRFHPPGSASAVVRARPAPRPPRHRGRRNCTRRGTQPIPSWWMGRRVNPPRPLMGMPSLPLLRLQPAAAVCPAPSVRTASAPRRVLAPQGSSRRSTRRAPEHSSSPA